MIEVENTKTVQIENVEVLTVAQFATLAHRSITTVHRLLYQGNQYRKLQAIHVMGKTLIPFSEFINFPFTMQGRDQRGAFHLVLGKKDNCLHIMQAGGYCSSDKYLYCDNECSVCPYYKELEDA